MDGTTNQELPQANNEVATPQPKEGLFGRLKRRVFGGSQDTQPITPKPPELPLEALQQDLANLEDIRKRGGRDWNDPQSRAQDDLRMEQLRAAIASRTPKPEATEEPTIAPVAPSEQQPAVSVPVKEPAAA